ncbi:SDR family NAD(P)-dependent oxidoreductase, partial [Paenibacillus albiflavus]
MLTGKVVVIIGGSSGIGLSTAKAVHDQGAHVVIAGRSQEKLNTAVKTIGIGVRSFEVEVADETSVRTMFDQLDRVDHVFVTASHVVLGAILDTDSADL